MDFVFQKEKIDGSDAVLQIQKNINVPVVYISGHSDSDIIEKITSTRSAWFLQKPFNRDELRITLELALFNHLQDSLHRSEKRYERIIESISDYIYTVKIKDNRAVETIHGSACKAITGYSRNEFSANPLLWYTIIPETEREIVKEHFSRMLRSPNPEPIEHRIINKNGRMRWIRNTPVFYFNSSGELEAYDGIISDVTERKMAEEALIAQREALEDLVAQRTENLIEVNAQLTKTEAELRRHGSWKPA
jgi:PAS domain S-box-containing protein